MAVTIQPGQVYSVTLRDVGAQVLVRAVDRSIARPGWWDCTNLETGQPITLPEAGAVWELQSD